MKIGLPSTSPVGKTLTAVSHGRLTARERVAAGHGPMLTCLAALLTSVAVLINCPRALAAPTAPVNRAELRTPSAAYRLGAADGISVRVMNFPELSTEATVTPDGKISLPLLGPIYVSGQTTSELAHLLSVRWSKFVIQPSVSIELSHMRPQFVTFYGFTARTGATDLAPGMHIVEALASVGGAPNGDLSHVSVTHKNGNQETVDISHPETRGGTPADIVLASDDVI
ncbi:MAG: polysaccharide biosynthesis/export family protein, partial [Chloroflexi bacterium]|nr:polysaccharide biosynthesis/export family protein [Chloroflexota bacterium]